MVEDAPARSGAESAGPGPSSSSAPYGGLDDVQRAERVISYDVSSYGFVSMAVVRT